MTEPGVVEAIDLLRRTIADLDGYIQRRAEELAAPLVEAAQAKAAEQLDAAAMVIQRRSDLVVELRGFIAVQERELNALRNEVRRG